MAKTRKIVFDLDGTLADCGHRAHHLQKEPKDWDAWHAECGKDGVVKPLVVVAQALWHLTDRERLDIEIELWTGRSISTEGETRRWLAHAGIAWPDWDAVRMRPIGDHRPDYELKREWAETYGWPDLVFEDRDRMVKFWRSHGVVCCQVAEGDF